MPAWLPEKGVPSQFSAQKWPLPSVEWSLDSYQFESLSGQTGWIFAHFSSIYPRFP
jgi:hypothetical protein